ncbi:ABATE domain-containing protein, partial [Idiomarina xiamenensis]
MTASVEFLFIASHLALDFVNTEVMVDQQPHDRLQSDDDVRRWLAEAEALPEANDALASSAATGTLLALARELRAELKSHLRLSRQQPGQQPAATLTVVNRILARGAPIQSLQ